MSDLLTDVLTWCATHPATEPVPGPAEYGDMCIQRGIGGSIKVMGEAPTVLAVAADLLIDADPQWLRFAHGILTLDVQPLPLHYRALGPDSISYVVVFKKESM